MPRLVGVTNCDTNPNVDRFVSGLLLNVKAALMFMADGVILTPDPEVWLCPSMIENELFTSVAYCGPEVTPTAGTGKDIFGVIVSPLILLSAFL